MVSPRPIENYSTILNDLSFAKNSNCIFNVFSFEQNVPVSPYTYDNKILHV